MKVFKYKVFRSNEEFTAWQVEKERSIHQIQPMISNFGMDISETYANANADCAIYVIYSEEV